MLRQDPSASLFSALFGGVAAERPTPTRYCSALQDRSFTNRQSVYLLTDRKLVTACCIFAVRQFKNTEAARCSVSNVWLNPALHCVSAPTSVIMQFTASAANPDVCPVNEQKPTAERRKRVQIRIHTTTSVSGVWFTPGSTRGTGTVWRASRPGDTDGVPLLSVYFGLLL